MGKLHVTEQRKTEEQVKENALLLELSNTKIEEHRCIKNDPLRNHIDENYQCRNRIDENYQYQNRADKNVKMGVQGLFY